MKAYVSWDTSRRGYFRPHKNPQGGKKQKKQPPAPFFAFSVVWQEPDSRSSRRHLAPTGKVLRTPVGGWATRGKAFFICERIAEMLSPAGIRLRAPVGRQVRGVLPAGQDSGSRSCAGSGADALAQSSGLRARDPRLGVAGRKGGSSGGCKLRRAEAL